MSTKIITLSTQYSDLPHHREINREKSGGFMEGVRHTTTSLTIGVGGRGCGDGQTKKRDSFKVFEYGWKTSFSSKCTSSPSQRNPKTSLLARRWEKAGFRTEYRPAAMERKQPALTRGTI
jgi:hypothetical protein